MIPLPTRSGSALLTALLGLLVLELAVAGVLYVGTQEAVIAQAYAQRIRARLAAESAVHLALAQWPGDSLRALLPGGVLRIAGAGGSLAGAAASDAEIERLHGSWYVVNGTGRTVRSGPPAARAAALVSMLETASLWQDFGAAVTAAGDVAVAASATVDALHTSAVPAAWSAAMCPAAGLADAHSSLGSLVRPALRVAPSSNIVIDPGAVVAGSPASVRDSTLSATAAFAGVGPLTLDRLAAMADRVEAGSLHLAAASTGSTCLTGAHGNWGDPSAPGPPCQGYLPLIYAPGDLEVLSGEGQGMLVVRGRLRLAPGTLFAGAILALGGADARGTVLGALRAGPGASAIEGSATFNVCALWRAFTGPTPFRKPYRRGARWWLPAF
ncbi:MAG: hypothetical protein ACREMQ_01510 [Longimicrobiales bacterium]